MHQIKRRTLGVIIAAAIAVAPNALADSSRYSGVVDLEVRSGPIIASHHHDWDKSVSYIQVGNVETQKMAISTDSPPFTYIWLSPDQRYFVGLSKVRVENETQLFVLDMRDDTRYRRKVSCGDEEFNDSRECAESVTNFVFWYDQNTPQIEVEESNGKPVSVVVDSYISDLCVHEEWKKRPDSNCGKERVSLTIEPAR